MYATRARKKACGHRLARKLKPTEDDDFVLKPMHSAFYSTTLDVLLKE